MYINILLYNIRVDTSNHYLLYAYMYMCATRKYGNKFTVAQPYTCFKRITAWIVYMLTLNAIHDKGYHNLNIQ